MAFDTQYDHAQDGGVLVLRKQKFLRLHNTSSITVKFSEWTRDIGVVTRNTVFVGEL